MHSDICNTLFNTYLVYTHDVTTCNLFYKNEILFNY